MTTTAALNDSEICVVVQGAVAPETSDILSGLRKILPNSEIILSTWEGQDTFGLDFNKIIYSKDPGAFVQNRKIEGAGHYNNVNRQIVSTHMGLRASEKKYTLKTRTDIFIDSTAWLDWFGKYDVPHTKPTFFNHRVLICNYYCRNPRIFTLPLHWSDWVFFGETTDLVDIFGIPLMDGDDTVWFDIKPRTSFLFSDNINRYVPEQWILSSFLKKHVKFEFNCFYDITKENLILTERFIAENTVILDLEQWGIRFVKYRPNRYKDKATLIHHNDWHNLYRYYALNKRGVFWFRYLFKSFLWKIVHYYIRPRLMRFLTRVGVGKFVRNILNRR